MWRLLNKKSDCRQFTEQLESAAGREPLDAAPGDLLAGLSPASRAHHAGCAGCRAALEEAAGARALLARQADAPVRPGPWFVSQVMAAIDARETELVRSEGTWIAVPKYASRLAFLSLAAILVLSTVLVREPSAPVVTAESAQESLFESNPPPMTHDDVLLSLAERSK